MVCRKCLDFPGRSVDPDSGPHLEGMALDAALKLLKAVMREANGMAGEKHCRQRHVKHERRMVASAEAAADIGELRVDPRRLEGGFRLAEQMCNRFRRFIRRLHAKHEFEA